MLGYNIQGINKFMTTNSKNPLTTKVNEKKPDLGQVYTNIDVARFMVSLLDVRKDSRILDPCFGKGIFIDVCKEQNFKNISGYELDDYLYNIVQNKYPKLQLYHSDFLKANKDTKFDAIIMNPPYIRQEKIDDLKLLGITKENIRKDPIYNKLPNKANMYMYFIIKALNILKDGGELVVIFPSSWINSISGRKFKEIMCALASIERQIHISGKIFESEALVDVIILKLIRNRKCDKKTDEYAILRGTHINISTKNPFLDTLFLPINFNDYASVKRGLTTGYNSMFINPKIFNKSSNIVSIISTPKNIRGYSTDNALSDKLLYIKGPHISEDIKDYLDKWKKNIIKLQKPKTLYEKIKTNKKWYRIKLIPSTGILFSYFIRNDMKFIMNNSQTAVRDNFYIIQPKIDKYLLFALLNSYYTYYQLECSGKKHGANLLKIQRYDIENLLFPDINKITEVDKKALIHLAKNMVETNENRVGEITKIIASYTEWDFDSIIERYETIKRNRIEGN